MEVEMSRMMTAAELECRDEFQGSHYQAPRFAERLGGLLAALAEAPDKWFERIQQRRELAGLDDRMLEDIGLDRDIVEREIAKPFWQR